MNKKTSNDVCTCNIIHEDIVEKVKNTLPNSKQIDDMSIMFKAFGDPTRLKILHSLLENEMCVCDLSHTLDMTQSAISHQLKVLKNASLVKPRRDGKIVYYSIADEHVYVLFNYGRIHVNHL